jgi:hypothetical protein
MTIPLSRILSTTSARLEESVDFMIFAMRKSSFLYCFGLLACLSN